MARGRWRPARLERAFWSVHSRTWDDPLVQQPTAAHIDEIAEWLANSLGSRGMVADLGCGTGNHSLALAARGIDVVGVDFSRGMLARGISKVRERGVRTTFIQANMHDGLPLRDGCLAGTLSVYSIQFFDLDQFVAELVRVLHAGGVLLVEAPLTTSPRAPVRAAPHWHRAFQRVKRVAITVGSAFGLAKLHTESQLRTALTRAGFEVIDVHRNERQYTLLARALAE